MDSKKITIIVIVSMLIISNLPIINTEILGPIDGAHFRYANGDASFTYIERMDVMIPWVSEWTVRKFIAAKRPSMKNMEVYRLYKINLFCFWRWRYYWIVSRHFEYKSWDKIEPKRVSRIPDNMWQRF